MILINIQGPPNLWQHNFILKLNIFISCYNYFCRCISFLKTSILYFRRLNFINNIISTAINRETIVSLHKKSESNSTIAKELQIRRETIWKVVKKFRETGQTSSRPGQGRKRTVWTKRIAKNTREKLRTNPRRSATKLPAEAGISRLRCAASLRKTSRPSPTRCRRAMS